MTDQHKSLADALRARKSDPNAFDKPPNNDGRVGYRVTWHGGRYLLFCTRRS